MQETQETWVRSLGQEATLDKGIGNPLQCSCLENSMDRGAWWATVHGVAESDTTERLSLSLQLKGFKNEKKKKGNVPGLLLQWRLRNPSGVPLRGGCLSRTECLYLACTQSACTPSPAPAGTVEEKCGWGFMETSLNKPVEVKLQTSNTHRIETFSEHKRRSMIPSCSYLALLKNNET